MSNAEVRAHRDLERQATLLHDVRTSLTALRLIVEGLRDGIVEMTPDAAFVDQMLLHVLLLDDLLEEPARRDRTRPGETTVAIGPFLEQWLDAMRPTAARRDVDLRLVVAPALPDIECRSAQLARVVLNLIDNAVRHTPAGGTVTVTALTQPGGIRVHVDDTGSGLRLVPETATRPVARPPQSSERLGLVIVRTIVEDHGGALWAVARPGGASVRFYLPATVSSGAGVRH